MLMALMAKLADFLHLVEQVGHWHVELTRRYTVLVPKEGPPEALNTVLSVICRLWAGCASWKPGIGRSGGRTPWPLASGLLD